MNQLRLIPDGLSFAKAAAIPAVSLTALYALHLGGRFPFTTSTTTTTKTTTSEKEGQHQQHNITVIAPSNKSILIHSAAGGVGSMLVQMSKILGLSPIVGVVGRTAKVDEAKALGCDVVIDKQQMQSYSRSSSNNNNNNNNNTTDMWKLIEESGPQDGYSIIMDPNGISTLKDSYDHLCPTGRLIIFGFHSNLPMTIGQDSSGLLNPIEWMKMIYKSSQMPQFNPMELVSSNKSVLGFNLSFFVDEIGMLMPMYDQIEFWLTSFKKEEEKTNKDKDVSEKEEDDDDDNGNGNKEINHKKKPKQQLLRCPRVTELPMDDIVEAHKLIQSGKTVGKLVMITDCDDDNDDETTILK
jgi:NADPH:quinone reductase-like Zn-dependent oxidoreductase